MQLSFLCNYLLDFSISLEIHDVYAHTASYMSDEQFNRLSVQLGRLGKQMGELTEAVKVQGERIDRLEDRLGKVELALADVKLDTTQIKIDVRLVYRSLDTVLNQQDIETNERVRITDVLNRHERWITGLANHANLKLSHD